MSSFNIELWVQAQHPYQDPGPSSRQLPVGGFVPGGFNSDVVGQWNSYVDIRGDSVHWDDIEHVGPGMPTTWNVAGVHPNSQNRDMGLDLALNGHSVYQ